MRSFYDLILRFLLKRGGGDTPPLQPLTSWDDTIQIYYLKWANLFIQKKINILPWLEVIPPKILKLLIDWFGGHLSSQDRVLILCMCIIDMSISIITDMHVDNQIRDGHIIIFVKKKQKRWNFNQLAHPEKKIQEFFKIIFENLANFFNFGDLASLYQKWH